MFKVESYITPFLLGYVDKYVKLKREDFQLSLWGGDAVLNKLDLRLDELEGALHLPICFQSGHIHELRLHVPWTKLGSEPVVVTINTIECVLRLRDESSSEASSTRREHRVKPKPNETGEDIPPGYLHSLMNRVLHNINIVVNNLILKFTEDDIVLSINIKSAECYSVDQNWVRAFIDLALPELTLRRLINIHDLTICLDRRDASGKIAVYQDPVLYRCSVVCRLHTLYESLHSSLPVATKLNVLCERLDISLTDTQLPMFCRLIELALALYYGTLGPPCPTATTDNSDSEPHTPTEAGGDPGGGEVEGWVSWAWSYVPQILPEEEEDIGEGMTLKPSQPSVLALGFYINQANVAFKLSEYVRDGGTKVQPRPCLSWESECIALEVLIKGVSFFNVQLGIAGSRVLGLGPAMCGVWDLEASSREPCFARGGTMLEGGAHQSYHLSQSLFDSEAAENLGVQPQLNFDPVSHVRLYTQQYALSKFGLFWMDYMYCCGESTTQDADMTPSPTIPEKSSLRFVVGPLVVHVSSSMTQRLNKFLYCISDHQYEPYPSLKPEGVDEDSQPPDVDKLAALKQDAPLRTYEVVFLKPSIYLYTADLPTYDVTKKLVKISKKTSKLPGVSGRACGPPCTLPMIVVEADSARLQISCAMYPHRVVKVVSKLPTPPDDLLHLCHSHTHIKLTGLSVSLCERTPEKVILSRQTLLSVPDVSYQRTRLLLEKAWKNPLQPRDDYICEIPSVRVGLTKPQLLLLGYMWLSWQHSQSDHTPLSSSSLLLDTFHGDRSSLHSLELMLTHGNLRICYTEAALAFTGNLGSVRGLLYSESKPVTTILCAPDHTSQMHDRTIFIRPDKQPARTPSCDFISLTVQLPNNPSMSQAPATSLVQLSGVSVCLDPTFHKWLAYEPRVGLFPTKRQVERAPSPKEQSVPGSRQGSQDSVSGSTTTIVTDSQARTRSVVPDGAAPESQSPSGTRGWSQLIARHFPLLQIMVVQVEVRPWCIFVPTCPLPPLHPSDSLVATLQTALATAQLPDTTVVCTPIVTVTSQDQRHIHVDQEIPIKTTQHSISGEKLPWTVKLSDACVYTVHPYRTAPYTLSLVDPTSLSTTVAVTTKYHPPLSDNISALAFCTHSHIQELTVHCSKPQVSQLYNLLSDFGSSVVMVTKMGSLLGKMCTVSPTPQQPEPPSQALPPISETSDSMSLSHRGNSSTEQSPKLSLWLQCTLLKLTLNLYVKKPTTAILVKMEMEDLTSSVDTQEVFSKVKLNVGSLDMNHFIKRASEWQPGAYKGVILTKAEKVLAQIPTAGGSDVPEDGKEQAGFLSVTLTRALQHHTQSLMVDSELLSETSHSSGANQQNYLNEICINLQPIDLCLICPVLSQVLDIVTVTSVKGKKVKSNMRGQLDSGNSLSWTVGNLPLLYINMGRVRVLIPNCTSPLHHLAETSTPRAQSDSFLTTQTSHTAVSERPDRDSDVLVFEVRRVLLRPHADNPVSRTVLDQELYEQAVKAGTLTLPGSVIENRQYQIDVQLISLASGVWSEIVALSSENHRFSKDSTVQNPAVEWNALADNTKPCEEVQLTPIASGFNMRVVAAPPVVYTPPPGINQQAVLVCGFSLEINATSDMNFYLASHQVQLLAEICTDNLQPLLGLTGKDQGHLDKVPPTRLVDSGVDSDLSTCRSLVPPLRVQVLPKGDPNKEVVDVILEEDGQRKWLDIVPFDVLLTANQVSLMVYDVKSDLSQSMDNLEISAKNSSLTKQSLIKPLLHASFSQPHSVVSFVERINKAELSCHNITVKAANPSHTVTDQQKLIPDPKDFTLSLLDTKPGRPDNKTGIPPSLYTVRLTDYPSQNAQLDFKVERPLKVALSTLKLDQLMELLKVFSFNKPSHYEVHVPLSAPRSPDTSGQVLKVLKLVSAVHLSVDQLVVTMETTQDCGVELSLAGLQSDTTRSPQEEVGCTEEVSCVTELQELAFHTTYGGRKQTILGPFNSSLSVKAQWFHPSTPHSGSAPTQHPSPSGPVHFPQIVVLWEANPVIIICGQETVLCLEQVNSSVQEWITSHMKTADNSGERRKEVARPNLSAQPQDMVDKAYCSTDDLRSGDFVFVTDDAGTDLLPAVGEIVFGVDPELGQATMTWCYPIPRVVTHITVTPVPFSLSHQPHNLQLPCVIQFWDVLSRKFIDYKDFSMSENSHTSLELPELSADFNMSVAVSAIWRILVLHPDSVSDTETPANENLVPLISPVALAASTKVESAFSVRYIPMLQVGLSTSLLQLKCVNHMKALGKKNPARLEPFTLDESELVDQEFMAINCDYLNCTASYISERQNRVNVTCSTSIRCDIIEYRNHMVRPLLETSGMTVNLRWLQGQQWQKLCADAVLDQVTLNVSPEVTHTLALANTAYKQRRNSESERIILQQFVICNDTQRAIHIRQVGTDEQVVVESRRAHPYSWRSHQLEQMLEISLEGGGWCKPFSLDQLTVNVREVNNLTLVVDVKMLDCTHTQVTIRGQLMVVSRLSQALSVRLLSARVNADKTTSLPAMATLASFVVDSRQDQCLKLRIGRNKGAWSSEIPVGEHNHTRLVKLMLHDRTQHIHVWCQIYTRMQHGVQQKIVLLSPLFVVRTQLPSPMLMNVDRAGVYEAQQVVLDGGGAVYQLHTLGNVTHKLTFQLSPHMKPSAPAVSITSGLIDQIISQQAPEPSIEDILGTAADSPTMDTLGKQDILVPTLDSTVKPIKSTASRRQPNIDLQIDLRQLSRGSNTVLIDVRPRCLIHNDTGADLVLILGEAPHTNQWKIHQHQTLAPPPLSGAFRLGVMWNYILHQTPELQVSDEDNLSRYLPDVPHLLYLHTTAYLTIPLVKDGVLRKVCHLTIHSTVKDEVRRLTVRERFCLTNLTPWPLDYKCLSLWVTETKVDLSKEDLQTLHTHKKKKSRKETSNHRDQCLLLWDVPSNQSSLTDAPGNQPLENHVQYISFKMSAAQDSQHWSHPVRVKWSTDGKRQTVVLPRCPAESRLRTHACSLSMQTKDEVIYLMIHGPDQDPPILVHNNCPHGFQLGQTAVSHGQSGRDGDVEEEVELTTSLPTVEPYTTSHYAFPSANTHFPDISKTVNLYKLRLRLCPMGGGVSEGEASSWSQAVTLDSLHPQIVSFSAHDDPVKISTERVGHSIHVYVDPVLRAEISAKEIRSRIKNTVVVNKTESLQEPASENVEIKTDKDTSMEVTPLQTPQIPTDTPELAPVTTKPVTEVTADVIVCKLTVRLHSQSSGTSKDLLGITAHDICVVFTPEDITQALTTRERHYVQRLMLGVRDLQLDNLAYNSGGFAFPVVFVRQDWDSSQQALPVPDVLFTLAKRDKWAQIKKSCLLYASVQMHNNLASGRQTITKVRLASQPIALYLEDNLLYQVAKYASELAAILYLDYESTWRSSRVPSTVYHSSLMLAKPLCLHDFSIEPVDMLLSVHASFKLFLAVDNTPLLFGIFERSNVFTSHQYLVKALMMHFISGALFRAGWVLGSLEILGNPAGLVRSVGTGVSDLFRLPYEEASKGPGALLRGVTKGVRSLLKHISTGTVTSVTNFASSVSQNMERMSLDSDHCERQEAGRRHRPDGLSTGVKNGLTGLGLSLLGAVAGIADQPLQNLAHDDQHSVSATAAGFVSGLGKGLVGMVTKPIGGAAELISQTGMGLLQGSGMSPFPPQLCNHGAEESHQLATDKYRRIIGDELATPLLVAMETVEVDLSHDLTVVLTSSTLYVMDADGHVTPHRISDVECTCDGEWESTVIVHTMKSVGADKQHDTKLPNTDRVAEFIDRTAQYTPVVTMDTEGALHEDAAPRAVAAPALSSLSNTQQLYRLQMDARWRDVFLTLFNSAKNCASEYGFYG